MKKSRDGPSEGAKDESKSGGTKTAADEFAVVGGGIGGERVGNSGENGAGKTVEGTPKSSGENFGAERREDSDKQTDGSVGEEKTGGEKGSGRDGKALEPRANGGEEAEDSAGENRGPRKGHEMEFAKGWGQRQIG